jgi:hypothetical protein
LPAGKARRRTAKRIFGAAIGWSKLKPGQGQDLVKGETQRSFDVTTPSHAEGSDLDLGPDARPMQRTKNCRSACTLIDHTPRSPSEAAASACAFVAAYELPNTLLV